MRAYRSRCRQAMSALHTDARESSLLPTLVLAGNYNRKGASAQSGDGLITALLPTLTPTQRDNSGGARPGHVRRCLKNLLPTLVRRDAKGPGPRHTRGGADLPQVLQVTGGRHLNPIWCLWFMGFSLDWLDVDDAHVFARSATP